jgi:hypothetical protein
MVKDDMEKEYFPRNLRVWPAKFWPQKETSKQVYTSAPLETMSEQFAKRIVKRWFSEAEAMAKHWHTHALVIPGIENMSQSKVIQHFQKCAQLAGAMFVVGQEYRQVRVAKLPVMSFYIVMWPLNTYPQFEDEANQRVYPLIRMTCYVKKRIIIGPTPVLLVTQHAVARAIQRTCVPDIWALGTILNIFSLVPVESYVKFSVKYRILLPGWLGIFVNVQNGDAIIPKLITFIPRSHWWRSVEQKVDSLFESAKDDMILVEDSLFHGLPADQ